MSWSTLKHDYTDAVWEGLRKYQQISNEDGTVSFQDKTVYTNKENSFFGAKDANQMNEAMNYIMTKLENGTDLYSEFTQFFADQKAAFQQKSDSTESDFKTYVNGLKTTADSTIATIKSDYKTDISNYKTQQQSAFDTWFASIKSTLSEDAAGKLQVLAEELDERLTALEAMAIGNNFSAPIATDDSTLTLLVDDNGAALMADWKYKEA